MFTKSLIRMLVVSMFFVFSLNGFTQDVSVKDSFSFTSKKSYKDSYCINLVRECIEGGNLKDFLISRAKEEIPERYKQITTKLMKEKKSIEFSIKPLDVKLSFGSLKEDNVQACIDVEYYIITKKKFSNVTVKDIKICEPKSGKLTNISKETKETIRNFVTNTIGLEIPQHNLADLRLTKKKQCDFYDGSFSFEDLFEIIHKNKEDYSIIKPIIKSPKNLNTMLLNTISKEEKERAYSVTKLKAEIKKDMSDLSKQKKIIDFYILRLETLIDNGIKKGNPYSSGVLNATNVISFLSGKVTWPHKEKLKKIYQPIKDKPNWYDVNQSYKTIKRKMIVPRK